MLFVLWDVVTGLLCLYFLLLSHYSKVEQNISGHYAFFFVANVTNINDKVFKFTNSQNTWSKKQIHITTNFTCKTSERNKSCDREDKRLVRKRHRRAKPFSTSRFTLKKNSSPNMSVFLRSHEISRAVLRHKGNASDSKGAKTFIYFPCFPFHNWR